MPKKEKLKPPSPKKRTFLPSQELANDGGPGKTIWKKELQERSLNYERTLNY
jgi:hypothetical protein